MHTCTQQKLSLADNIKDLKYYGNQYRFPGRQSLISTTWRDVFTEPVHVVDDKPCYSRTKGYKIHAKQTLADFFSRAFPRTFGTNLSGSLIDTSTNGGNNSSYAMAIGTDSACHILIHFMRTIRVLEDGKEYNLPRGLGSFPLYDTQTFKSRLPTDLASQGGVFLPMHGKFGFSLRYELSFFVDITTSVY